MLFNQCIELKKMIVRYNQKKVLEDDFITCDFNMFQDGMWSCVLRTKGCVELVDIMPVLEWAVTLYVSPFMWGNLFGFKMHIQ